MPCDAATIPSDLTGALSEQRLVPLVGPALSKLADPSIPNWEELLDRLADAATSYLPSWTRDRSDKFREKGDFRRAASIVVKELPTEIYVEVFEESFSQRRSPAREHRMLVTLGATLTMTTNYDALLEQAFVDEHGTSPAILTHRKAEAVSSVLRWSTSPTIFKVFGSADDPFGVVFGEESYSSAQYDLESALRLVFSEMTVLALGYQPRDPAAKSLFELVKPRGRHFVAFPETTVPADVDVWRERYGLEPIVCGGEGAIGEVLDVLTGDGI